MILLRKWLQMGIFLSVGFAAAAEPALNISLTRRCQLGDAAYDVPERYLWLGRFDKTRHCNQMISMLIQYPSMEPTDKRAWDENREIRLSVSYSPKAYCRNHECVGWDQYRYERMLNIQEGIFPDSATWQVDMDNITGLHHFTFYNSYRNPPRAEKDIFFQGSFHRPTYWLACTAVDLFPEGRPLCESEFRFSDGIYVEYVFSRIPYLKDHHDIRSRIQKLIEGMEIKP